MSDRIDHDDDLAALRAIGGRIGAEPVAWEAPPADLWGRIAAEAGVDPDLPVHAAEPQVDEPIDTPPAPPTAVGGGSVVPFRTRRQVPWILAVAAALVVVAGAVTVITRDRGDETTLVASSTLDALELAPEGAAGSAELVEVDGQLRLKLDVEGLGTDEFHEVWVIDTEVSQLISLGPVRADGTYDLPPGIDPAAFPIVDVSIEPLDGDPTHSGQSVLRGQLTF